MSRYSGGLVIIIIIAWALRLYNLTYHSLWFDEAISVYWARQSIPRILEVGFTLVEDRLPPLYYLMLKGWAGLFGFTESGVRTLSVVFGVVLVPVTATIARQLFNRRVALITAALVALNPFLIWYAQEARMYAPAAFFGTLGIWAFLKICPPKHWQPKLLTPRAALFILLFILTAIAGLYSHLYVGFLLPALGLWLVISYPRRWQLWLLFATGGVVITLAFAPIALAIWQFSAEAAPGSPLTGLARRAWWLLQSFTVWKAPLAPALQIAIPAVTLLFALLAYLPIPLSNKQLSMNKSTRNKIPHPPSPIPHPPSPIPHPLLLVTMLFIFPFIIANILLLRNHLAFFGERYFIVMVPWLLMLAAAGADKLAGLMHRQPKKWRTSVNKYHASRITYHIMPFGYVSFFTLLPPLLLLTLTALPIPGQWSIPAAKEAWRQSVNYLARQATPNDAILIHPDWVRYPFQYYFEGPGQTYAAFSTVTPNTPLDGPLQGVVGDHAVIWLVQSHLDGPDPNRLVERWLASRYPLVTELYPPGIAIKGYAPGYQLDTLPAEATPVDLQFTNGMRLVGYRANKVARATDNLFHPPSGWVHVTLYWVADRPITGDARPIVQLVGPGGVWGANLHRATDALNFFPPSRWPVGRPIIRQDMDVNLNPATPPGTYHLVVSLHGDSTQHPLTQIEVRQ